MDAVIWPPEIVYLSPRGDDGPVFVRHRGGVAVGHAGRVTKMEVRGLRGMWCQWSVSNRHGARNTLAMAIRLYDPFQGEVGWST